MVHTSPTKILLSRGFPAHNEDMRKLNLVGPRIRRFRNAKHWSQERLAAKLQLAGLDKSRQAIARIECQIVHVCEFELFYFAKVLGVGMLDLFPDIRPDKNMHEVITELMKPRKTTAPTWQESKTGKDGKQSTR